MGKMNRIARWLSELLKIVLAAFLGAVFALTGQVWLNERHEAKVVSAAACRLLPDMDIVQDGLALVSVEPLPQLYELPEPSALQAASRSAEGLPPESYRMAISLRDTWVQIQITLVQATIGQDAGAKARLMEIATEAGQRTDALRSDLQRLCHN